LTKANQRATDNSVISSIGYTVNNIGQRTNATRSGSATNTTAWGYDALGQVTSADDSNNNADRAYLYDTIGNRKKSADSLTLPASENYSVNALNQYTNIGGFVPTYDKDGNQLNAQIQPQASATLINAVYEWDGENRLRRVKNSAGAILVEYHYDAQSRRIATSANGTTTLYLYDGWNVIAEYQLGNATFNLHTSYLWGLDLSSSMQGAGGVGGLLAVTEISATSAPATYYPLFDGNGNITEYINNSEAVVAHYQYDPFGNTTVASGTKANDFAYRFSTKPLDSATGLYYYGYRYYTPQTGRWINRDPIEEKGGVNLHGMVRNDTINQWDLLGMCGLSYLRAPATHLNPLGAKTVPLSRTGCVPQVTKAIQPQRDAWKKIIEGEVDKKGQALKCPGKTSDSFFAYDSVGANSGVWWIGGISLRRLAICTIKADCKKCTYSYDCKLRYEMADTFSEPLNFSGKAKLNISIPTPIIWGMPGATLDFTIAWPDPKWNGPNQFTVTHSWKDSAKGGGGL
jgi:RHS repeat-associated protein